VPVLQISTGPGPVTAAALVLHGGQPRSERSVPPWSLAYLRMRPFATALRRAGAGRGVAVASLRHLVRGWNGEHRAPVADARWALDELRRRFGDIEIALIGHSMGGRTALAAADDPSVRVVVALAPWIEAGDSVAPIAGRSLLIVHGTSDRMTSPQASAAYAEAAREIAAQVTYVAVEGGRHAMLRRPGFWHQLTAGYAVAQLTNKPPNGTVDPEVANVLAAAVAGTPLIRV
jgi:alpha-beta hydrolase superfamily lysophospholipase